MTFHTSHYVVLPIKENAMGDLGSTSIAIAGKYENGKNVEKDQQESTQEDSDSLYPVKKLN